MATFNKTNYKFQQSIIVPVYFICIIFLLELANQLLGLPTNMLGNRPRQVGGLIGIFTMPLAHGDFQHLFNNAASILVLGSFTFHFYRKVAFKVITFIWLFSGSMVWLFARGSNHIGASGVVYGLAFFLFFSGVFRKDKNSMVIALIVSFFYGSMVWGVLPGLQGISWEGHLFGAFAGVIAAYFYQNVDLPLPAHSEEPESSPHDYWKDYVND